jgi:hypothetical protein
MQPQNRHLIIWADPFAHVTRLNGKRIEGSWEATVRAQGPLLSVPRPHRGESALAGVAHTKDGAAAMGVVVDKRFISLVASVHSVHLR